MAQADAYYQVTQVISSLRNYLLYHKGRAEHNLVFDVNMWMATGYELSSDKMTPQEALEPLRNGLRKLTDQAEVLRGIVEELNDGTMSLECAEPVTVDNLYFQITADIGFLAFDHPELASRWTVVPEKRAKESDKVYGLPGTSHLVRDYAALRQRVTCLESIVKAVRNFCVAADAASRAERAKAAKRRRVERTKVQEAHICDGSPDVKMDELTCRVDIHGFAGKSKQLGSLVQETQLWAVIPRKPAEFELLAQALNRTLAACEACRERAADNCAPRTSDCVDMDLFPLQDAIDYYKESTPSVDVPDNSAWRAACERVEAEWGKDSKIAPFVVFFRLNVKLTIKVA